jgi:uncharacterized protein YhdP
MSAPSLLKVLLRIKLATIATLLVTIAIMVSLLRLSMYYLPDYKNSVEQWLSKGNYQVSINALDGEWNNLWPRLNINGMQLSNAEGDKLLEFGDLELELNLMAAKAGVPQNSPRSIGTASHWYRSGTMDSKRAG